MATTHVLMRPEQFDALPEREGLHYELLDGELIEVPSASARHNYIAGLLTYKLNHFLVPNRLAVVLPETEFAVGVNRLRPDIAVMSKAKFELIGEGRSPVPELPEIAVEIASPSESAPEMERKVAVYLEAGVTEVWVVYPRTRHLFAHTNAGARLVDREGVLTTDVLPGWSLRVGEIFSN